MHQPKASDIVAGLLPGEFKIRTGNGEILVQGEANITSCALDCAAPCIPQQFTITFPDADYGDCNSCGIAVGFSISRVRDTDFDLSSYLYMPNHVQYEYPAPAAGGVVTGATIATYFENLFANSATQADVHDNWGIIATRVGAVLTLVIPCHYTMRVLQMENTGGYSPTIVNTVVGQTAKWDTEQMKRLFTKDINKIIGQDVDLAYFSSCESVCVLYIKGCYQACNDTLALDMSNPVHLHTAGTKVDYAIFINSLAPGYAAFIAALAAALPTAPTCAGLTPIQGGSFPFASAPASAGAGTWDTSVEVNSKGFTFPGTFSLSNGAVTVVVNATSFANLVANLNADPSTSIASAYATPNMSVTGFGTGIITLRQVG